MFDQNQNHTLFQTRHKRLRETMRRFHLPALVVLDPVNILYATGARNMQVFGLRVPARYLLVFVDGPTILFEYTGCEHLARGLPTIDEIRAAQGLCQVSSGRNTISAAKKFCDDLETAIKDYDLTIDQIAIDRFPLTVIDELRARKFALSDADEIFSHARSTKLPEEIPYIREAVNRVEVAVEGFETSIRPGLSEVEIWAELHRGLIASEGQYITTRLCQSGEQTFPYFQESNNRRLQTGDLVCLDTDAIGFMGYGVDFSRSFLCDRSYATNQQKILYQRAREQLETNAALLKAGAEYREIADKAWKVPEEHQASRYYCIGHGLGLSGEFPNIPHISAGKEYPLSGHLEAGMVICVESYIGSEKSQQGIKLEDQFLITEKGTERLSNYKFDDRFD